MMHDVMKRLTPECSKRHKTREHNICVVGSQKMPYVPLCTDSLLGMEDAYRRAYTRHQQSPGQPNNLMHTDLPYRSDLSTDTIH